MHQIIQLLRRHNENQHEFAMFFCFCFFCHLKSSAKNHLHLVNLPGQIRLFPADPATPMNQPLQPPRDPSACLGRARDSLAQKRFRWNKTSWTKICSGNQHIHFPHFWVEDVPFRKGIWKFSTSQTPCFFLGGVVANAFHKNGNSFEGKPHWLFTVPKYTAYRAAMCKPSTQDASALNCLHKFPHAGDFTLTMDVF